MNKILVTGGAGFIGRVLVRDFLNQNFEVIASVRRTCAQLHDDIDQVLISDICGETDWSKALVGVHTIVHLAARAHITNEQSQDPLVEFRRTNVSGTKNLARQAAISGVKKFIFISSIGVNGSRTKGVPFTSKDIPNPESLYAISKYEAEQALLKFSKHMDIVIIRPPLVYGGRAPGNFGLMIKAVAYGIPLPLGLVNNQRSFVSVENLVSLIVLCVISPAAAGQTFMVSDGEDLSTTLLLRRLGSALKKKTFLVPVPRKLLEMALIFIGKKSVASSLCGDLQVDISETKKQLKWAPTHSVDQALLSAAEDFLSIDS